MSDGGAARVCAAFARLSAASAWRSDVDGECVGGDAVTVAV